MAVATKVEELAEVEMAMRQAAQALGAAFAAVSVPVTPQVARSVAAQENLYERIAAEFGLYTAGEAGTLMGSRSKTPRNKANAERAAGRLVAITRLNHALYPGFQFSDDGRPLAVIATLRQLARSVTPSWTESSVVEWLMSPTTYLMDSDGKTALRPVDLLRTDPDRVVDVAEQAWTVQW